jgi:Rrf2 family transcriptional regulator, nitric oxide-sensitive transcriptional repressor
MFLGKAAKESPHSKVTTAQIATAFDIPPNHLVKIINELAHRGYVRTIRGPGGGVSLAPNAAKLRLGDLIESLQGPMHLHECVESDGSCAIESICKLRGIFRQADAVQRNFLNQYTLADIVPNQTAA